MKNIRATVVDTSHEILCMKRIRPLSCGLYFPYRSQQVSLIRSIILPSYNIKWTNIERSTAETFQYLLSLNILNDLLFILKIGLSSNQMISLTILTVNF